MSLSINVTSKIPVYAAFNEGQEAQIKELTIKSWLNDTVKLEVGDISVEVSARALIKAAEKAMI